VPKTFNLISNITNGAGLQKDTELLARMLESYGHKVTRTMFNDPYPTFRRHDVNIFLEVISHPWLFHATENWLVPNSEWWGQCWEPFIPRFNKVLCKTKDCLNIWNRKVGNRAIYTGFEANDYFNADVPRQRTFLHLAGKSETKNTAAVIAAWRTYNLPYPLIVSAFKPNIMALCKGVPNVTLVTRFGDDEAKHVINECLFHVMPSKNEGFGHAIHEALGCKGIVITTDAPPMNEFAGIDKRLCVGVERKSPRPPLTFFYEVNPGILANMVHKAAQLNEAEISSMGELARAGFLSEREFFRNKFEELARA
jgi:hypothetical protein